MGVRTLVGKADGTTAAGAMYDSTSGWMIGPIFEAEDAAEQIEAFLKWMRLRPWLREGEEIFGMAWRTDTSLLDQRPGLGDGSDPRHWTDGGLERLVLHWRREHVGDDGWLLDVHECGCGHRHIMDDAGADPGCSSLGRGCFCREWRPGNPLGEKLVAAGETGLVR